jgi:transcriptional regulator GlxA family with amidase domain
VEKRFTGNHLSADSFLVRKPFTGEQNQIQLAPGLSATHNRVNALLRALQAKTEQNPSTEEGK